MNFPRPQNFPYTEVFYYDGNTALIKGRYKKFAHESIGMRWMSGEEDLGYPNIFGKPMWMVVPRKMGQYILEGIFRDIETQRDSIIDFPAFMDALEFVKAKK